MKKFVTLLSLIIALGLSSTANAQYCGSANAVCGLPTSYYGFGPLDSIHCVVQNTPTTLLIPFKNYNSFTAQGNHVNIQKLRIDTISNLPCGLCWSTNKATNEFLPNEDGCFQIQGTTTDAPGEYKAHLILSVATQNPNTYDIVGINANAGGVYLYIRVQQNGQACVAVDTSNLGLTASCATPPLGINEATKSVSALSIQPNPMSSEAKVTFSSETSGQEQVRIINIVGSEVYNTTINAKVGMNETTISRNNLPAGIYILSVGNAQGMTSKKFIIAE